MSARHIHFSLFGNSVQDRPKTAEIESMRIGRVTWFGLTLAVVGWAMMLGEMGVQDILTVQDPRMLSPTFHDDFVDIAKTLIFSGFGLALVGALQTGFGALNRFFEAVLVRSGQRAQAQALPPAPIADTYRREETAVRREDVSMRRDDTSVSLGRMTRPYKTFADGSVEVETILGNRRFRTMAEARDFI